jgi:hypothetical protein
MAKKSSPKDKTNKATIVRISGRLGRAMKIEMAEGKEDYTIQELRLIAKMQRKCLAQNLRLLAKVLDGSKQKKIRKKKDYTVRNLRALHAMRDLVPYWVGHKPKGTKSVID